ncbi:MAG: efflux RND transporter periplasmic adaptor subunit [Acidobacteriaceae bacterium]|jgi:cobalt-zinc-cadmium efflux system membrane fusion protein|nr:efflux RND transporter periplasmic adaptor subunit [Acidobacteriaceae bacterium]
MTASSMMRTQVALVALVAAIASGCARGGDHADPDAGAPPPAVVEQDGNTSEIRVEHPDRFPLATATAHESAPTLKVTGVVTPDVSRAVPVVSLASGRVVEIHARLGDTVHEGDLLLRVQSTDVSGAMSDYRKARTDAVLAQGQLTRATELFGRGAIAKKDLEVAQDTADNATVDVENATERLRVLGVDPSRPPVATVDVTAPASGVITEQNVTNAAGVKTLDNSPNLFTISDLSRVWILCDVYENDLATVRLGDTADIIAAAYPDTPLSGRISNIGAVLDPDLRTAKVRVEVANPGMLRVGMFVTATFRGQTTRNVAVVPETAILHLHDREWVYVPGDAGTFHRVEVTSGKTLPDHGQEILSGLQPGQRVIENALIFQNTVEQ